MLALWHSNPELQIIHGHTKIWAENGQKRGKGKKLASNLTLLVLGQPNRYTVKMGQIRVSQ